MPKNGLMAMDRHAEGIEFALPTTPYNEQMTSSIETLPSLFDMTQPWWDKVSYLLAPDGVVDQEVVDLWLERALLGSLSWK